MKVHDNTTTIPKQLTGGNDLVVVRRRDYERLQRLIEETQDALGKVKRGEKEHRRGATKLVHSLSETRRRK